MSVVPRPTEAIEVFFSYAHEDEDLRDELEKHLSTLKRQGVITDWHDRKIGAGTEWEGEIDTHLNTAHVILLLISADFMASDYCWDVEVKWAMERHEAEEARVIPIILRPVDWEGAPFGKLQALPMDAKPVTSWANRDEAFLDVARGIRAAVEALAAPTAKVEPEAKRSVAIAQPMDERPTLARQPLEPEMILIPAGEFLMGSNPQKDKHARDNEQPQHTLYLPDYYIAKTPVTNAQYAAFVETTVRDQPQHWIAGKPPRGKEDHPVWGVLWYDAVTYCRWLSQVTGKSYCLPSEAEWEKAARGTDGRIYPWGNQWDAQRCNSEEGGQGGTTPVGVYPEGASPFGALDMAGSVWEWTGSLYELYPYSPGDGLEDPKARGDRVVRGGSWFNDKRFVRCAYRNGIRPGNRDVSVGFRVVVSPGSP